jgi:hypothetical protein
MVVRPTLIPRTPTIWLGQYAGMSIQYLFKVLGRQKGVLSGLRRQYYDVIIKTSKQFGPHLFTNLLSEYVTYYSDASITGTIIAIIGTI